MRPRGRARARTATSPRATRRRGAPRAHRAASPAAAHRGWTTGLARTTRGERGHRRRPGCRRRCERGDEQRRLQQAARNRDPARAAQRSAGRSRQRADDADRSFLSDRRESRPGSRQPGGGTRGPEQPHAERERGDMDHRPERPQQRRGRLEAAEARDAGLALPATAVHAAPHIAAQCGPPASPISRADATSAESMPGNRWMRRRSGAGVGGSGCRVPLAAERVHFGIAEREQGGGA